MQPRNFWHIVVAMLSVSDIIERAGGPVRIANAIADGELRRTVSAIRKWNLNGIPRTHYDIVAGMASVTVMDVHEANRALADASRQRPKSAALSSAA